MPVVDGSTPHCWKRWPRSSRYALIHSAAPRETPRPSRREALAGNYITCAREPKSERLPERREGLKASEELVRTAVSHRSATE